MQMLHDVLRIGFDGRKPKAVSQGLCCAIAWLTMSVWGPPARAEAAPSPCDPEQARGSLSFREQIEVCARFVEGGRESHACLKQAAAKLECALSHLPEEARSVVEALQSARPDPHALQSSLGALQSALPNIRFNLVSQGGVSLGSWQAGFAYYLTEWVKLEREALAAEALRADLGPKEARKNADPERGFATITGASAGAVNGLAIAIDSCQLQAQGGRVAPNASLLYKVWVNSLGLYGRHGDPGLLFESKTPANPLAIFDERPMTTVAFAHTYAQLAGAGFASDCQVDLGFAVTHLDLAARPVHVDPEGSSVISRNSLREKFVLRLKAGGDGRLTTSNLTPPQKSQPFYALLGEQGTVDPHLLMRAVQASGSFPVAFPPVDLPYGLWAIVGNTPQWRKGTFVDGGTFDNTPVGVAIDLNRWRDDDQRSADPFAGQLLRQDVYFLLEPNVTEWALHRLRTGGTVVPPAGGHRALLPTVSSFMGSFLSSSLDAEYLDVARANPFMLVSRSPCSAASPCSLADSFQPRLVVPRRRMPLVGDRLAHFLAFLEEDFRVYDFYVGMADAEYFLNGEEAHDARLARVNANADLHRDLAAIDPRFACMSAYYREILGPAEEERPLPAAHSFEALPRECRALTANRDAVARVVGQLGECSKQVRQPRDYLPGKRRCTGPVDQLWAEHRHMVDEKPALGTDTSALHLADAERAVGRHNFASLLVAMHQFRRWLMSTASAPEAEEEAFFHALAMDSLDGKPLPAGPDEIQILRDPRFIPVDGPDGESWALQSASTRLGSREAHMALRILSAQALHHLALAQPAAQRWALDIVGPPTVDAEFDAKIWSKYTFGVGFGSRLEGFFGRRFARQLRGDIGLRLKINQDRLQQLGDRQQLLVADNDLFARLLVPDLASSGELGFDPYAGAALSWLGPGRGAGVAPLVGMRLTFIDRLSASFDVGYRWSEQGWTTQTRGEVTFQFLYW